MLLLDIMLLEPTKFIFYMVVLNCFATHSVPYWHSNLNDNETSQKTMINEYQSKFRTNYYSLIS